MEAFNLSTDDCSATTASLTLPALSVTTELATKKETDHATAADDASEIAKWMLQTFQWQACMCFPGKD